MELSKKINFKIFIFLVISTFIILNIIYLNSFDDYYDDWNFFYTVDSNISDQETWQRHYGGDRGDYILKEAYPWVFTYFTKYILKYIGYSVENTHYILLIFSTLAIFYFYKLSTLISKDFKFKILAIILFSFNLFLIRELNAFRPHSPTLFLSLVSSYSFIKIFIKNVDLKKNYIIYFFSTFLMLTIWPQSLAVFAGQIIFSIIFFSKFKKIIIIPIVFIVYILFNFEYIIYLTTTAGFGYTPFEIKFFYNYFFRSFFGSIFLGGIMLALFAYFFIKKILSLNFNLNFDFHSFKKKEYNTMNYFLIIILTIYSAGISYSLVRTSVMAPKYFIPLLPIIILWITYNIYLTKKNILFYGVAFLSIFNCIYFWNDLQIDRPPMREALKIIYSENKKIKTIYTTELNNFNNFLSNYKFSKNNNFEIKKLDFFNGTQKEFAILCQNNARYAYGDLDFKEDSPTCTDSIKKENFYLKKTIKIPDFIIYLVEYKN